MGHRLGGLGELVRRLQLTIGDDDPGAAFAFGFGLARHRPLHRLRQGHVLDLDAVDVDAPVDGGIVDHDRQALIEAFAVGEQIVEFALADDRPQRGLRDLPDGELIVLDIDDGLARIDDLEVDDGVDADGDVVAGDALLSGNRHRDDLEIDLLQIVDERDDRRQPGRFGLGIHSAEAEDHPALILSDDLQAVSQRDGSECDKCGKDSERQHVESPPLTTDGPLILALVCL